MLLVLIVEYRKMNGKFEDKHTLLKVSKLGNKAYEQCAGFLRITDGNNVLDNTGVHPESFGAVEKLLELFGMTKEDVANGNVKHLPQLVASKGEQSVADSIGIGVPTLQDIVSELTKPGRDIRDELPKPVLKSELLGIEGVVRNVIDFGVFVDISVHQDGLVHISEISKDYIKHPSEVLKVGDQVTVKVTGVDIEKKRISLTIKGVTEEDLANRVGESK